MKMKKILSMVLAAAMMLSLAACGGGGSGSGGGGGAASGSSGGGGEQASNGGETIKIICGYAAGGTADLVARKWAQTANEIQKDYNFIVENQTGGDGFAAATAFSDEDPSTKDLLVYGYGAIYRHDNGQEFGVEEVDWDRANMDPIGIIDDRTPIMYAAAGTTLADILDQCKNGGIKMSGGNPLSDYHLMLGSLATLIGGKVQPVPYDGGANQKKALTDGEVQVFVGTTQAAQDEVEAGTIVPILAFAEKPFEGFKGPDGAISVPTVAGDAKAPELPADIDFTSCILASGGSLATHTGADEAFIADMEQIMKDVWQSESFDGWIASVLLNHTEIYGDECAQVMDENAKRAVEAYKLLSGQA